MSETLQERYKKLTYIYALPCPKCGAQWDFELTPKGWTEICSCNCEEYHNLIAERENQTLLQPKHDLKFVRLQKPE